MQEPYFDPLPPILEVCIEHNCPVLFDFGLNLDLARRLARTGERDLVVLAGRRAVLERQPVQRQRHAAFRCDYP